MREIQDRDIYLVVCKYTYILYKDRAFIKTIKGFLIFWGIIEHTCVLYIVYIRKLFDNSLKGTKSL